MKPDVPLGTHRTEEMKLMSRRRLSTGTPTLALTADEQRARVEALDKNPAAIKAIEVLTGVAYSTLTFGQRLQTYEDFLLAGEAAAPVAKSAEALKRLEDLAAERLGEVAASDRVLLLEQEVESLRAQVQSRDETITVLREQLTAANAQPALAVHSGGRDS